MIKSIRFRVNQSIGKPPVLGGSRDIQNTLPATYGLTASIYGHFVMFTFLLESGKKMVGMKHPFIKLPSVPSVLPKIENALSRILSNSIFSRSAVSMGDRETLVRLLTKQIQCLLSEHDVCKSVWLAAWLTRIGPLQRIWFAGRGMKI